MSMAQQAKIFGLIFCFTAFFLLSTVHGQEIKNNLEALGFEDWEDPNPEEIKQQFQLITQKYKASRKLEDKENFQKAKNAFESLKAKNFVTEKKSESKNFDQRHSNPSPNQQGSKFRYTSTDNPQGGDINFDEIFNSFNIQFEDIGVKRNNGQFEFNADYFSFLVKNPKIFIAAFLISLGLLNLCTCFCCCCCCCFKCCKNKEDKVKKVKKSKRNKKQSQSQPQPYQNYNQNSEEQEYNLIKKKKNIKQKKDKDKLA